MSFSAVPENFEHLTILLISAIVWLAFCVKHKSIKIFIYWSHLSDCPPDKHSISKIVLRVRDLESKKAYFPPSSFFFFFFVYQNSRKVV